MRLFVSAACHTGKIRKNNEDNFFLDGIILPQDNQGCDILNKELTSDAPVLVGVFDGMGGHDYGEVASYLMASETKKYAASLSSEIDFKASLVQFCLDANDVVCQHSEGSKMGTTAAIVCIHQSHYTICNIGDSPVFLWRKGQLMQISEEHTQRITYERTTGKKAPPRKKFPLTQCIGISKEELLIEPYCSQGQLKTGDILLLCSDGLTDMLSLENICDILGKKQSDKQMLFELVSGALEAGGRDNITAICVRAKNEDYVSAWFQKLAQQIRRIKESSGETA